MICFGHGCVPVCLFIGFLIEIHLLLMWQESESEEDILDEGDEDDDDLEEEHETQVHPEAEPEVKKAPEVPAPPKEPERQLSKKELKQKELAEFEALLADFGIAPKENNGGQDNSQGIYRTVSTLYWLIIVIICSEKFILLMLNKCFFLVQIRNR